MPNEQSPRRIVEHQAALRDFNSAYTEYLEAGPSVPNANALRDRVLELIPRTQAALRAAGVQLVVTSPRAMPRRIVYDNLASTAFLHEEGIGVVFADVPQRVLDNVRVAFATLEEKRAEIERQRRRPLYWPDRAVSAFLRFPSYIVAKMVGVPTWRIANYDLGHAPTHRRTCRDRPRRLLGRQPSRVVVTLRPTGSPSSPSSARRRSPSARSGRPIAGPRRIVNTPSAANARRDITPHVSMHTAMPHACSSVTV